MIVNKYTVDTIGRKGGKLLIMNNFHNVFLEVICFRGFKNILSHLKLSHIGKPAAEDFEPLIKIWNNSRNEGIINEIQLITFLQKEKLLDLSNFSFCQSVFKSRLLQMRQNASTSEVKTSFALL